MQVLDKGGGQIDRGREALIALGDYRHCRIKNDNLKKQGHCLTSSLPQPPQGDWATLLRQQAGHDPLTPEEIAARYALVEGEAKAQLGYYQKLGVLGRAFHEATQKAAIPVRVDSTLRSSRAILNTFNTVSGFRGDIELGHLIVTDHNPHAIFAALTHEATHLVNQYYRVPATHASPFNTASPVVLCPRDAMKLNVLLERQAFAMQLLMEDLLQAHLAQDEALDLSDTAMLQARLRDYAQMRNPRTLWADEKTFVEYYSRTKLNHYEEEGRQAHMRDKKVVFARMSLADIRGLNECFGLKTFADDDAALQALWDAPIDSVLEKRILEINRALGIDDEEALACLDDAYRACGIEATDFMNISAHLVPPPPTSFAPASPRHPTARLGLAA